MRCWLLAILLGAGATLTACEGPDGAATAAAQAAIPASLPATVEGLLAANSAEGKQDAQGYSEFNIGTLRIGETELLVEVSGTLLRNADIPPGSADVPVRATLGSRQTEFDADYYTVTALERTD
jgi:hypothetical protein